jgi:DNA-binding MarR family transcriptional regulator
MATLAEKHDGDIAHGADRQDQIRLWLRMLSCTMVIDKRLRAMLGADFETTLPRFDVLAALNRAVETDAGGSLTMGQLSRALLVSNGNVTALVQTLVRDGQVETLPSPTDRRSAIVRLTPAGATSFRAQAEAHHNMIHALFAGLDGQETQDLYRLLGRLKTSISLAGDAP